MRKTRETKEQRSAYNRAYRLRHLESEIFRRAQKRAKLKGIVFKLRVSDILIPSECPILGIPLFLGTGPGGGDNSPSLDRKNNDKGYISGNVQVISNKANVMKNSASVWELVSFAKWVQKTYGS